MFTIINEQHVNITPVIDPLHMDKLWIDEFLNFINCINTGCAPNVSITAQAAQMIKVIERIYKSAETKLTM